MTILTDANGKPFAKPAREDFASVVAYVRAYHEYRDRIAKAAAEGFCAGWREARVK